MRHSKIADERPLSGEERSCSGHHRTTEFDPACVKTHTIAKCRKYNSPTRYRTSCAQHDSTPCCAISSRCFYVRGGRWSFRTAKTHFGHAKSIISLAGCTGENYMQRLGTFLHLG